MKLSFKLLVLSLHFKSNGVNADGLCRKERNNDFKCGSARGAAPYWPATTTCTQNECCCAQENGWDSMATYQRDTCNGQVNSVIGCFACSGVNACKNTDNIHVGDSSCTSNVLHVGIYYGACERAGNPNGALTTIGIGSCWYEEACTHFVGTIGDGSCKAVQSCFYANVGITIGDGSCNAEFICKDCESGSVVPDGTCNDVNNLDEVGQLGGTKFGNIHDEGYRCRACFVSTFFHFIYLSTISFL